MIRGLSKPNNDRSGGTYRRLALAICLLWSTGLVSQDLQQEWHDFLLANDIYQTELAVEGQLVDQYLVLNMRISQLETDKTWYNEWIVKYRIAGLVSYQLTIADSLRLLKHRLPSLKAQYDATFTELKQSYEAVLFSRDDEPLSQNELLQALEFGDLMTSRSTSTYEFPDYTDLIQTDYNDETVKKMVLQDLKGLIRLKLVIMDSLVSEIQSEMALARRLQEFQSDLSYQLESDIDPVSGSGGTPSPAGEESYSFTGLISDGGERMATLKSDNQGGEMSIGAGGNLNLGDPAAIAINLHPLDSDLKYLSTMTQKYRGILQTIDTELSK